MSIILASFAEAAAALHSGYGDDTGLRTEVPYYMVPARETQVVAPAKIGNETCSRAIGLASKNDQGSVQIIFSAIEWHSDEELIPHTRRQYRSVRQVIRAMANGQVFSLYVQNIPNQWAPSEVYRIMSKYGEVVDVYIPRKVARNGQGFGFVRFRSNCDLQRLLSDVNRIQSVQREKTGVRRPYAEAVKGDNGEILSSYAFLPVRDLRNSVRTYRSGFLYGSSRSKQWQHGEKVENRLFWVHIRGIPLIAWSAEFINVVGSSLIMERICTRILRHSILILLGSWTSYSRNRVMGAILQRGRDSRMSTLLMGGALTRKAGSSGVNAEIGGDIVVEEDLTGAKSVDQAALSAPNEAGGLYGKDEAAVFL
ncbi:hypothetical protein Tsubulata_013648 [Turnera subulata]|uniref:RRM domain-containing protein n=1 Tax=Turnera subulata TaxID=218843 RepID=A0A9Q0JP34_9ROSI|nr:hypothetical protein Tsubulata_013648 [Turnera subulata]